jgi:long-chain acyl-CoA synthetase
MTSHSDPLSRRQIIDGLTGPGAAFEVGIENVFGAPTKVYRRRPRSLRDLFGQGATGAADLEHVVHGSRRWTFREFAETTNRLSAGLLAQCALQPGDRVAIVAANSAEWMMTFWATVNVGAIAVGVNGWWKRDEILYALRDSGASVLVADEPRLDRIAADLDELDQLRGVYLIGGDTIKVGNVRNSKSRYGNGRVSSFDALTVRPFGDASDLPDISAALIDEDDPAIILYTSGTTGRSKGAVSTHRSMIANVQNTQLNAAITRARIGTAVGVHGQSTMLLTSPMFHVSGCHSGLVVGMASTAKVVMPVGRADATTILQLIQDERVTTWPTVPTLAWRVAEHPGRHDFDTSSLTAVAYGGSPSAAELQRRVEETFPSNGSTVRNAYGLTESSSVAAVIEGQDLIDHPTSVGMPMPVVDVQITDESGAALPPNHSGEIWLRGATIMAGYWNNATATAEALTPDRWLRTGDVGMIDDDGYLYIVDRLKDVIIRGGENIYCVEIENRLVEHPAVLDAAVVGVPHPTLGEEVMAIVQIANGIDLEAQEVQQWVAETLADFKVPRYVRTAVEPLPRNASGKLLKNVLRGASETQFAELM